MTRHWSHFLKRTKMKQKELISSIIQLNTGLHALVLLLVMVTCGDSHSCVTRWEEQHSWSRTVLLCLWLLCQCIWLRPFMDNWLQQNCIIDIQLFQSHSGLSQWLNFFWTVWLLYTILLWWLGTTLTCLTLSKVHSHGRFSTIQPSPILTCGVLTIASFMKRWWLMLISMHAN